MKNNQIVGYNEALQGSPVPNPLLNPSIRTADIPSATNPTGQLSRMYQFAALMNNTQFATRSNIPEAANARVGALLRKAYVFYSFEAMLQVLTYMDDENFAGFAADPTMRARFMAAASTKCYTLLPEVLTQVRLYIDQAQTMRVPTTQVVAAIRAGASLEPLVRSALVFQNPSMFTAALESLNLYHYLYLLCRALNGFLKLTELEPSIQSNVAVTSLRQVTKDLTDSYFLIAPELANQWNMAMSTVSNMDVPNFATYTQNLNVVATVFEQGVTDRFHNYELFVLRQFKRVTDARQPNWLSPVQAMIPVSADAVEYTVKSVKSALVDLKTVLYAREV